MSFGNRIAGHHHCGGATVARRVSGRDGAVLAERPGANLQGSPRLVSARMLVACEYRRAFLACQLESYDLALIFPATARRKALFGTLGQRSCSFPRESLFGDEILGVPAGMLARDGIVQPASSRCCPEFAHHPCGSPNGRRLISREHDPYFHTARDGDLHMPSRISWAADRIA
jgi:hypothetical protein